MPLLNWLNRIITKSLTRQLVMGITLTHAVLMTVFIVDLIDKQKSFLLEQNEAQAFGLVETLATNGASWLISNDVIGMEEIINAQLNFPNLSYAMFIGLDNEVLSHTDTQYAGKFLVDNTSQKLANKQSIKPFILLSSDQQIDVAAPIIINDKLIGWARVGLDRTSIADSLVIVSKKGIIYMTLAVLVGAIFAYLTGIGLTRAIRKMIRSANDVSDGGRDVIFEVNRLDEIGTLSRRFDKTMHTLENREEELHEHKLHLENLVDKRTLELQTANEKLFSTNQQVEVKNEKLEQAFTDLKNMQKQLVEAEKLSSLGSLVIGVSHQINTPLGVALTAITSAEEGLNSFSDKINQGQLTKKSALLALENLITANQLTHSNIDRSVKLVNKFKQIATIQTVESIQTFSVKEHLNNTLSSFTFDLNNKQIKLSVDAPDSVYLKNDPGQFSILFTNLVANSIKHGFKNSDSGEINIIVKSDKFCVTITYSDNGVGMEEEQANKLYEPFYTTELGKGNGGLGMYLVYNIINQVFNGNIDCKTKPNHGVKFTLSFPINV